ncbi:MAG: hypothetical protein IJ816_02445 [Alloprevotella sp.]|nr:hypothetical protein [Alloprevotella sp.]
MILIENDCLQACFTTEGAELLSLKSRTDKREFLWQGDPEYWHGHSPILFPITGGLWNGECRIEGKIFRIPKHGFVQRRVWDVIDLQTSEVTFACTTTEEEKDVFPYEYNLQIRFALEKNRVTAQFKVENLGENTMFFQIGGHPAIALPDFRKGSPADGFIQLEGKPTQLLRAGEQGCIEMTETAPARYPIPFNEEGLVPICESTFANEALIFDEQLSAAVVLDLQHQPLARVTSSAPVWLFWSPQGKQSPFVCLEPWYGLPDFQGFSGDISQRPYINSLQSHSTWSGNYDIEVFI